MIRNRDDLDGPVGKSGSGSAPRDSAAQLLALDCVEAGIRGAKPRRVVREAVELRDDGRTLTISGETYDLDDYEEVVVLGGGKAAVGMAAELDALLGKRIDRGVVVTDDASDASARASDASAGTSDASPVASDASPDASDASPDTSGGDLDNVSVREGDHPVPNERGVAGAREVLAIADEAGSDTLVLAVMTGGASALLPAPAEGLSLADLQATTEFLLESGATIEEINAVRKHLSALKGGRLAERAAPATVVGLVLSDVVGNDLGVIASGPLSPDPSTFGDALGVLDRYGIDAPSAVRERLERGASGGGDERGEIRETPAQGDSAFERVSVHVLADGMTALRAAAAIARERGYDPIILSSRVRGEAREAARSHAAVAEEIRATGNPIDPPAVVLSGGETTVTVRGEGEGGPNLEFALSWALEVEAEEGSGNSVLASVDTDGRDGGTDVAGALVDDRTVGEEISSEAARDALADNDALGVLANAGCAILTGPTGTNVNDLQVVVVED